MKKSLIILTLILAHSLFTDAQIINPKRTAKRQAENKVNNTTEKGVEKGLDKIEEGIKGIFKKKNKKQKDNGEDGTSDTNNNTDGNSKRSSGTEGNAQPTISMYSKFDFIPGEKVLAFDDFSNTNIGDFPTGWNSSGSAEIVTLNNDPKKWLFMRSNGFYMPEFVSDMPENFTLEFDIYTRYRSSNILSYNMYLYAADNVQKEFSNAYPKKGYFKFGWSGCSSAAFYEVYENGVVVNKNGGLVVSALACKGNGQNEPSVVHFSIWRQKERIRVYANETKILDVPRAFNPKEKYNSFKFTPGYMNFSERDDKDQFMVSNVRYAVGAPDTRSSLVTKGKFVTTGILFDVNSDRIQPTSYAVVKEIADVLKEHADMKIKIVGHTDNDGDDKSNQTLSEKRAAAVKNLLSGTFGIAATRMDTEGKGESQPAVANTTAADKANNRRVEFIKL